MLTAAKIKLICKESYPLFRSKIVQTKSKRRTIFRQQDEIKKVNKREHFRRKKILRNLARNLVPAVRLELPTLFDFEK